MENIVLAGGCLWGMQDLIRKLPGVVSTRVGYTGGDFQNPTYKDMCTGKTGHAEAVEITFDPSKTNLRAILLFFFQAHDPTTLDRQGNDMGTQYRSAIFYANEAQKQVAHQVIADIEASGKWPGRVVTEITPASTFYVAEAYHQDYLVQNPQGYTCHFIRRDWVL